MAGNEPGFDGENQRWSRFPLAMAGLVVVAGALGWLGATAWWFGPDQPLRQPWLVLDIVFHAVALATAVGYAYDNKRWLAALLSLASPFVFVFFLSAGPSEPVDFWGSLPSAANWATAFLVGNLILAIGLILASVRAPQRTVSGGVAPEPRLDD